MVYTENEVRTAVDKNSIPGYVYLMDDGRDLKLGITRNINNRVNQYITENPRLTCHGYFQASSLAHAEQIERELIDATSTYRTHGKEWCRHCDEVFSIWNKVHRKYAKFTYDEWLKASGNAGVNKSLKIVATDAHKRFAELRETNQEPTFVFKDIVLSDKRWFDGECKTTRKNLFNHCREFMQKNLTRNCHWEGDDLVVVEKEFFNRISPEPLKTYNSQSNKTDEDNNHFSLSFFEIFGLTIVGPIMLVICLVLLLISFLRMIS